LIVRSGAFVVSGVACLGSCVAIEIERPRGASRINPLLHLLQRGHACEVMVVSLVCKDRDMRQGWQPWRDRFGTLQQM
jgi:hypothetical protein